MRADHRRIELVGRDLAGGIDQHVADHREPVLLGIERAQAVGELLRQHRNDAAREVDRGRALIGIVIERVARLDIVADVGDGHHQPPALAPPDLGRLAVDRIVEVARVLAVDRHQRHVGQVDALLHVDRAHPVRQLAGLRQRLRREAVRHLVLAHRDLDLHAGIVDVAEHLGDAPDRLRMQRRRLGQLDGDHLAGLGLRGGVLRDQDVLTIALVLRRDDPDAVLQQQPADDRRTPPLQDLQHPPLRAPLAVVAHDAHPDPIAMQHRPHFLRRQIDVGFAALHHHEAVTVTVTLHRAFHFTHQRAVQRNSFSNTCGSNFSHATLAFFADRNKISKQRKSPGGGIGRRTSFRY